MNVWRLITHHIDAGRALTWTLQNGRIAIGWGRIGDLRQQGCRSSKDIGALIREHYPEINNSGTGGVSLWNFFHEMQVGDLVILSGSKPRETVVEVQGDYEFQQETPTLDAAGLIGEYQHQRRVRLTAINAEELWRKAGASPAPGQNIRLTLLRCAQPVDAASMGYTPRISSPTNVMPVEAKQVAPAVQPATRPLQEKVSHSRPAETNRPASQPPTGMPPEIKPTGITAPRGMSEEVKPVGVKPTQPLTSPIARPNVPPSEAAMPGAAGQIGRNNKLTGQIGEFLVCAELGRRGYIATPFSGNVPAFDVIATDELCRTVPIQVKASNHDNWPARAQDWMNIDFDPATGIQRLLGPAEITNPDLIYVCVSIAPVSSGRHDRFFVLTKQDIQIACINGYSEWMEKHDWKRPRNASSLDCRYFISSIEQFEDNWDLIGQRIRDATSSGSLKTPEENGSLKTPEEPETVDKTGIFARIKRAVSSKVR